MDSLDNKDQQLFNTVEYKEFSSNNCTKVPHAFQLQHPEIAYKTTRKSILAFIILAILRKFLS